MKLSYIPKFNITVWQGEKKIFSYNMTPIWKHDLIQVLKKMSSSMIITFSRYQTLYLRENHHHSQEHFKTTSNELCKILILEALV